MYTNKKILKVLKDKEYYAVIKNDRIFGALSSEYSEILKTNILEDVFWISISNKKIILVYLIGQTEVRKEFDNDTDLLSFLQSGLPKK